MLSGDSASMDVVFITCTAVVVLAFADAWLRQDS